MHTRPDAPILLVGAGRMGFALLTGWLDTGADPRTFAVLDPGLSPEDAAAVDARGVRRIGLVDVPHDVSAIVIAVKPQIFAEALPGIAAAAGPHTLVLSIAAGKPISEVASFFPVPRPVVRAMPNTPASIKRGMTVCCANALATAEHRARATGLLSAVGAVEWVADESQMDAVTAVSGSGPAYVFLLTECLAEAGATLGLDRDLAKRIARATVSGSGDLLGQSNDEVSALREAVTSPGGTTAAALAILQGQNGMSDLLQRAVAAAAHRSRELAG